MKTRGSQLNNISLDDFGERIKIMYRRKKRNERGDIIDGKEEIRCVCFAKVYPYQSRNTDGREVELKSDINYRVTIRHRDDIDPNDYIIWRDKKLLQRAPPYAVEGQRIYLNLECVEVIGNGKQT